MRPPRYRRTELHALTIVVAFILGIAGMQSCGGGGGSGGGSTDDDVPDIPRDTGWQRVGIVQISGSGLLLPNVRAIPDGNNQLHVVYFTDGQEASSYTINHILWDMDSHSEISQEAVIDIDNCRTLDLSLSQGDLPVVAYQGGTVRAGGSEQQSDVMFSILQNDVWTEYTGGIGFVERNPVFEDGLAGKYVSVAVDGSGDIHLCYQFFYEGIDAMNFNYPDLLYVTKDGSSPETEGIEETVEGNIYNPNGTASEQNRVGAHAAMMIDGEGNPVIFHAADLAPNSSDPDGKGLRVAYRQNGVWTSEWVETGLEVGDISCALDAGGNLCVAYYVESEYTDSSGISHRQCLKYATRTAATWTTRLVDEATLCGMYCSLAFDTSGNPAIAYYSMQNHSGSLTLKDLKLACYSGTIWDKQVVASTGDIGNYNSLWFDEDGTAYICTFSNTDHTIYLYYN
jgi:hypothetical protein